MSFLDEMDAIAGIKPAAQQQPDFMAQMDAIAAQKPQQEENPEERNWGRAIGELLSKGLLKIGDFAQLVGKGMMQQAVPSNLSHPRKMEIGPEEEFSEIVKRKIPVNLDTQKPTTAGERMLFKGIEAAPSAIVGGLPNLLRNMALTSATAAESQGLRELGAPGWVAEPLAIVGTAAAPRLAKLALKAPSALSSQEQKVAEYLQGVAGPKETPKIAQRLANPPKYQTGYEPTTAEVAKSPSLSAIERAEQGVPGSGIADFQGRSAEALEKAFERTMGEKDIGAIGEKTREAIEKGVKGLKAERREPTKPLYEKVKKMQQELPTTKLGKFFEENKDVAGDLEADLNRIKKMVKPKGVPSPAKIAQEQNAYLKQYEQMKAQGYSQKVLDKFLEEAPKSTGAQPTAARLSAVKKAINSRAQKYKRSGEADRERFMNEAKRAIEEDLATIPEQALADKLYRELSEPITEVTKQPSLKSILAKREGHYLKGQKEVIGSIFDNRSYENIKSINKSLAKHPEVKENLQKGAINHFYNSIKNAGQKGEADTLSFPKMRNFLKNHGKAMGEILSAEQQALVKETEAILKGQRAVQSLGVAPGSPTSANIRMHFNFANKTNPKALLQRGGKNIWFVGDYLREWAEKDLEKMTTVLHKALLDKELARKMYTHKFETQAEFSKFMNDVVRTSLSEFMAKEKGEE